MVYSDTEVIRRLFHLDAKGALEWCRDDNGGFIAEINGTRIRLCCQTLDRTRDGVVLTLINPLTGASGSLSEPHEKEGRLLRDDMRELFYRVEKKAVSHEDLWQKLAVKLFN